MKKNNKGRTNGTSIWETLDRYLNLSNDGASINQDTIDDAIDTVFHGCSVRMRDPPRTTGLTILSICIANTVGL